MANNKQHMGTGEFDTKKQTWKLKCPDCSWRDTATTDRDAQNKIANHRTTEMAKKRSGSGIY
jgi:hypothetical protein